MFEIAGWSYLIHLATPPVGLIFFFFCLVMLESLFILVVCLYFGKSSPKMRLFLIGLDSLHFYLPTLETSSLEKKIIPSFAYDGYADPSRVPHNISI